MATPMMIKMPIQEVKKLERFDGLNFMRWLMRLHFLLTMQRVSYLLQVPFPDSYKEHGSYSQEKLKWWEDDYVCRGMILGASDGLFDVFWQHPMALDLWNALLARYTMEDARHKTYLINKHVEYKMVDEKPILDQIQEMVQIAQDIAVIGEPMTENFQVSTIIGKLSPSWKDYQKMLKHQQQRQTFDELVQHLQIEEQANMRDKLEENQNRVSDFNFNSNKLNFIDTSNPHDSKVTYK